MSTPTPASPSTAAITGAVIAAGKLLGAESATKATAKRRGSNLQPGRTRFTGRNSRNLKRMISQVEVAKGRKLTSRERSACVSLSHPLTRDGGTSGR